MNVTRAEFTINVGTWPLLPFSVTFCCSEALLLVSLQTIRGAYSISFDAGFFYPMAGDGSDL